MVAPVSQTPRMESEFLTANSKRLRELTASRKLSLVEMRIGPVVMIGDAATYHYVDSLRDQHAHDVRTINDLIDKAEALLNHLEDEQLAADLRASLELVAGQKRITA